MFSINKMKMAALAAVVASSLACGGTAEEDLGTDEAALSTRSLSWVTIRADERRCAAPLCGGYFVKDANKAAATEQYVSRLDFSTSGLDDGSIEHVLNAAPGELVLRARLGAQDRQTKTRPLVVAEAYRGLPGMTIAAGDALYTVTDKHLQCVAAPCNTLSATKLGTSGKTVFTRVEAGPAAKPSVDVAWLENRVTAHGALVAAHVEAGRKLQAGTEKVLEASQVFVRLPETVGPCPRAAEPKCDAGQVPVYTRSADRCLVPNGCVTPGMCPMYMPACESGYTLASWPATQFGCSAYACDPTFAAP